MIVGVFVGIENNISICYKFQNDFNDYFQDKNNKNINDYKSIFVSVNVKSNKIIDFLSDFNDIRDRIFNDNSDINVSLFTDD